MVAVIRGELKCSCCRARGRASCFLLSDFSLEPELGDRHQLHEQFLPQNRVGDKNIYKKALQPQANSLDLTKLQGTGPLGPEHPRLFKSLKGHCPRLSPRLPRGPAMAEMLQGVSVCPFHAAAASARMSSQAGAQKQEGQVHREPSQRLWEAWLRERPKHQKVRCQAGQGHSQSAEGGQPGRSGWHSDGLRRTELLYGNTRASGAREGGKRRGILGIGEAAPGPWA